MMYILTEYKGGEVCGIFESKDEAEDWLIQKGESQSYLRKPQWFPSDDGHSEVFLHHYSADDGWHASHRLTLEPREKK